VVKAKSGLSESGEEGNYLRSKKNYLTLFMRTAILTLLLIGITATAQARLGENADELIARYGQPLDQNDQTGYVAFQKGDQAGYLAFQKGGFNINVTISGGISAQEKFYKMNGTPLTLAEVRTLLNANAQGYGWEAPRTIQGQRRWMRDDGAAAELDGKYLIIKSKEIIARAMDANKLEAKPSLDGF